jgi:signal transduction histidine kinase
LRTPLTAIRGNADLLRHHGERMEATERAEVLDDMASEAERMSRLIGDLLALARAQTGEQARRARRIGGDRRHAAIEAAEEGGDEIEARRVEEESPLPLGAEALEPGSQNAGAGVQARAGETFGLSLPVGEEGVRGHLPPLFRARPQQLYQRRSHDIHLKKSL